MDHLLHEPLPGPSSERSFKRLAQESQILVGAGSDEVALVLSAIIFYSLGNPDVLSRIKTELKEFSISGDNIMDCKELEQLPYLVCFIH